jgi:hypothetical protein
MKILSAFVVVLALASMPLLADNPHHGHVTEVVTEVTEVTEMMNTYNNYTIDTCQGVAIAQAGANNHMFMGAHKPQLSLGLGECGGNIAGSIMFGMMINKRWPMINGSIAIDENVKAYGLGMTVIFK